MTQASYKNEAVCPGCGKAFFMLYPNLWAYKTGSMNKKYFCSWKCLREVEKRKEEKGMKKIMGKAELLDAVIAEIEAGRHPFKMIAEKGYANPAQAYAHVKDWAAEHEPEKLKKLPANLGVWAAEHQAKKAKTPETPEGNRTAAAETPEGPPVTAGEAMGAMKDAADSFFGACEDMGLMKPEPKVVFSEDGTHLRKITQPLRYEGFTVDAVRGDFGRYARDTFNGKDYFDYESAEGEELSMPVEAWKEFLAELKKAAAVLGVEL